MNLTKTAGLAVLTFLLISAGIAGVELEIRTLLKGLIELKVPKHFTRMPEDMVQLKYPMESRPTIVYTDATGGINLALNHTKSAASQELIDAYSDNLASTFRSAYPSATWKENGVKIIHGRKTGYLELVTPALDTEIYNLIFFTDVEGKLLLCTFNCTARDTAEWIPIAHEVMESLKIK